MIDEIFGKTIYQKYHKEYFAKTAFQIEQYMQ